MGLTPEEMREFQNDLDKHMINIETYHHVRRRLNDPAKWDKAWSIVWKAIDDREPGWIQLLSKVMDKMIANAPQLPKRKPKDKTNRKPASNELDPGDMTDYLTEE